MLRRYAFKSTLVIAACVLLGVATWAMDRASLNVELSAYVFSYGFFANAVPFGLAFLLLLVLFNRIVLSVALTLLLGLCIYAANALKLRYLATPVSFSDLYFLQNLHVSTLGLLFDYVNGAYLVLGAMFMFAAIIVSVRLEPRFFRRWSVIRPGVCVGALYCAYAIGVGAHWTNNTYAAGKLRVVPWDPELTILHAGLLSSILNTAAESGVALEMPVDEHAVDALLALNAGPAKPEPNVPIGQRPDIVVVQSESFFDPGILKNIDNTNDELPTLHRALAQKAGGTMKVPTFGGGTLRTEFEVLTGIPMAAYPKIAFPYLQITQKAIPGIVAVVHHAGYATVAIHGNSRNFWNRAKAFKAIGFDQFIAAPDFPPDAVHEGWYLSDAAMTDRIMAELKVAQRPTLIFAISIEAHGPYMKSPVGDKTRRDAIAAPTGVHGKALLEYRNYLYHIENADRELGRLWDFLVDRGRPFVLVFYGDHLPGLQYIYPAAGGFDNGKAGPAQFVPWLLLGSGRAQTASRHLESWMMGDEILRAAGIAEPPYYRLIGKAERALTRYPDSMSRRTIMQGVYSLARLHLQHKLNGELRRRQKEAEVATDQSH